MFLCGPSPGLDVHMGCKERGGGQNNKALK